MTVREKVEQALSNTVHGRPEPGQLFQYLATTAITAFLEAAAAKGWHMRSDEATEEMKTLGARDIGQSMRVPNHIERANSCYRAMLAAAPEFEWDK